LSNLIGWLSLSETEKFVVIQNGIDLKPFYDAVPYEKSEICGTREDQIVLVTMVARFTPEKDQKTLIRCLSVLPEKVHVAFVGSGPLKGECEELAAELGVRSRVHFLGFRRDVPRILKTSDIVVLSSHREAFGLTAVEGMAAGKPVVGTNVQGLSDVIGDTALLFACGDYEGLGTIISRLLDDPAYYRSVAERFLQRSKEFDIRKTIEGLLDFYQQALGRTSS
jgi:glycosyltransferase involved in cell wall biosynthesis